MSISKLKAELQKMQSFDAVALYEQFKTEEEKRFKHLNPIPENMQMIIGIACSAKTEGAKWQHAKSARMAEMLVEAVEALEKIKRMEYDYHGKGSSPFLLGHAANEANETLTKLAKGAESE